jgi:pimeloyl-ACP methyl ester carboxylesterase
MQILIIALILFLVPICAGQNGLAPQNKESNSWRDPSSHSVQFVKVGNGVQLEILDWGGSGTPLVLLAGLGDTAHVFDDFASTLTSNYHVYGITRRGFGASSVPQVGYSSDQLGDDVLAVLDSLKLVRPILVGHSFGGAELSSVGTRHPERVRGLIYLDAGYPYAYYDESYGYYPFDLRDLRKTLDQMGPNKGNPSKWNELADDLLQKSLSRFRVSLEREMKIRSAQAQMQSSFSAPSDADLANLSAFRLWLSHMPGSNLPEAEILYRTEITADGHIGPQKSAPENVLAAIEEGQQKYRDIRVPALAIYAMPGELTPPQNPDKVTLAKVEYSKIIYSVAKAFEAGVPHSRVVCIPNAIHFVFISNENDVLREMKAFLSSLP